jgi:phage gpG-like protein
MEMTPGELADRLTALPMEEILGAALEEAAARLEGEVRASLSHPPGEAEGVPALRSGELRDSISGFVEDGRAVVGSSSVVAAVQEAGSAAVPPRPFLRPVAAGLGASLAEGMGAAVAEAVRGAVGHTGVVVSLRG